MKHIKESVVDYVFALGSVLLAGSISLLEYLFFDGFVDDVSMDVRFLGLSDSVNSTNCYVISLFGVLINTYFATRY